MGGTLKWVMTPIWVATLTIANKEALKMFTVENVYNLPDCIDNYWWLVVRLVDGQLWYYDAWNFAYKEDAYRQAMELGNGLVLAIRH